MLLEIKINFLQAKLQNRRNSQEYLHCMNELNNRYISENEGIKTCSKCNRYSEVEIPRQFP